MERIGEEKKEIGIYKVGKFIIFVKDKYILNEDSIRCIFYDKEHNQVRVKYEGLETNMARLRYVTFEEVADFLKDVNSKVIRRH